MASIAGAAPGQAAISRPSLGQRLYGLGSIYGKTLRDSRRATLVVGVLIVLIFVAAGAGMKAAYPTELSREELVALAASTPAIFDGIVGKAVNVGTLGGFVEWKYGVVFPLLVGLWSILALSSTLASETVRGSLEFVAAGPVRRRRIAFDKVAAHVTSMVLAMVLVALGAFVAGQAFGAVPGDAIPVEAAVGYAVWLGLTALLAGSLAFAIAPFLGRGMAAGLAGAVMFIGYMLNGYQAAVPAFAGPAQISWFTWTTNHDPLGGLYDWASLVPVGLITVVLLAVGAEAFARRDLGASALVRMPALPRVLLGLDGQTSRTFGQLFGPAMGWGIGIGLYGLLMASSSRSFADEVGKLPDLVQMIHAVFPNFDVTTPAGFLTLVFMAYGLVLAGFAAATLVGGWASDETRGRLELILSTPLSRTGWAIRGGLGVYAAIALFTAVSMLGIGLGSALAGGDVVAPVLGTGVLGLYGIAMAGIGLAVGGLLRTSVAALAVGVLTVVTLFLDFLVPALNLPDWVHQLALTAHLGQPMVGTWDWGGIAACLVLAVGGLAVAGWGMARRDVGR